MNKSLESALEKHYEQYPADMNIENWSGCNYYINQGNNEHEPKGTAQSMHDCNGCDKLQYCLIKQPTPIWEWNENIEKSLKMKTIMMNRGIQ